ncbi:MAG TPA: acyloxyacyl hydrolase [Ottowia sp.]|jgi:lipid A 3-O-deacylase|nr:acyloxyacyl hydrolase [Ottowia sp.]HMT57249.1 acyloxyacyl hydrolase [Ottowia sp.]HMT63355.1 acyloxyacyl hydrolase [Ottowia sp.]HMT82779.1 acyloxyacyl hydrolase [Ottowia sp.]HOK11453.1 acyloxyacyl hydrolase [Ottowia sp.]
MTDLPCCHSRFHPGSATRAPGRVAWAVAACLGAACGLAQAQAQPAGGLDWTLSAAGAAEANVSKLGVIAGWTQPAPLWQGAQWRLRLRHELELAAWRVPKARDLLELGYSPVLRLERPLRGGQALLFVEGSIGARLLSHTRVAPERSLSTAFQFSDMLGVGVQWGAQGRSTLGLRYQHVSNLGIKRPNPGLDFGQLYYTHRF